MAINLSRGDTRLIIDECCRRELLRNQVAYVLATTKLETAHTMKPIKERGGDKYFFKMYDLNGNRPKVAQRLGNTLPGDGVKFAGRGYVQITGRRNVAKASKLLGVDFITRTELLLKAEYAIPILIVGMRDGWFTGKKLSDYITLKKSSFSHARRIVNGNDKAKLIAGYAREYDRLLNTDGYGQTPPTPPKQDATAPTVNKPLAGAIVGGTALAVGFWDWIWNWIEGIF